MTKHRRTALAAAPLSLALLLAACSDDDSADPTTTTTTTVASTTSAASTDPPDGATPPSSEPTTDPADETSAPPETASEAGSPLPEAGSDWASELVRAWGAGDRDRAAELATPEVVDQLFGHADPGGDDWELQWCDSSAVELYCTFASAARGEALVTQEGGQGIATATFRSVAEVTPPQAAAADGLIQAWGAGDRDAAAGFASETDVQSLFGYADPGGHTWERDECLSIDGDAQCVYRSPDHDETVVVHLSDGTDLPVTHVLVFHAS